MAIGAAASELGKGNIKNAFSFLFVDGDVLAAQEKNRRYQEQRILEKQAAGTMTPEQAAKLRADFELSYTRDFNDPSKSVTGGFVEGAKDGLKNMQDGVKKALNTTAGGILGFVPWWVWILAGVALFLYMGGGKMLKGALK